LSVVVIQGWCCSAEKGGEGLFVADNSIGIWWGLVHGHVAVGGHLVRVVLEGGVGRSELFADANRDLKNGVKLRITGRKLVGVGWLRMGF
jgi:hypothetical protein